MRLGIVSLLAVLLLECSASFSLHAEASGPAPDFKEVYDLIREHLQEARAALRGHVRN
jgi:hypothetical protein